MEKIKAAFQTHTESRTVTDTTSGTGNILQKNANTLGIAAVIGIAAFLWTGVTEQPKKSAEQFSVLIAQNAEIKSTVVSTKTEVTALSVKLERVQTDQSQQASQIQKNLTEIEALKDRIDKLED